MCNAKPGTRCATDTCQDATTSAAAYASAHPGAPDVTPLAQAQATLTDAQHATRMQHATDRLREAQDALDAAHPRANTYELIAVADARQNLTLATLAAEHGDDALAGASGARLRLMNGVNAVTDVLDASTPLDAEVASRAPIGTLALTPYGPAAYKVSHDQWDLQMNARRAPELYGNWRGTDPSFPHFTSDAALARHYPKPSSIGATAAA